MIALVLALLAQQDFTVSRIEKAEYGPALKKVKDAEAILDSDPRAALENYGIDSILAMKLTNQLEKTFGSLPKTLFFEYQTIRELAGYFIAQHAAQLTALLMPAVARDHEAAPAPVAPAAVPAHSRVARRGGRPDLRNLHERERKIRPAIQSAVPAAPGRVAGGVRRAAGGGL